MHVHHTYENYNDLSKICKHNRFTALKSLRACIQAISLESIMFTALYKSRIVFFIPASYSIMLSF